jgi:hypothetical protein
LMTDDRRTGEGKFAQLIITEGHALFLTDLL